jgi:class 3 adenylate cyclase
MGNSRQTGYLVLADISGYTSYVAATEIEHAQEILAELLELIIERFKSMLTISKLEGDAVFAFLPGTSLPRGETLLELVELTYLGFRDRIEATRRRTTCECNACQAIPNLDLKFIIHYGDYIAQDVSGIHELLGSDVNLAHRLLKNHVSEAIGSRAYALFTAQALAKMEIQPDGLVGLTESYEHLGEVEVYAIDLHQRYSELLAARVNFISPQEAMVSYSQDIPAPPEVVWDWLNEPGRRSQCMLNPHAVMKPVFRPGGRTGAGALNHCIHGKNVAMQETVIDWRPFDYFTVEQTFSGFVQQATFHLEALGDGKGTRLTVNIKGHSPAPGPLDRPMFLLMARRLFPYGKMIEKMADLIQAERSPEIQTPVWLNQG